MKSALVDADDLRQPTKSTVSVPDVFPDNLETTKQ